MNDAWRLEAACIGADTDWFFPRQGDWVSLRNALALCAVCPVRSECLEAAMVEEANDLRGVGIRGGKSARERRLMRRRERAVAVASGDAVVMVVALLEAVRDEVTS